MKLSPYINKKSNLRNKLKRQLAKPVVLTIHKHAQVSTLKIILKKILRKWKVFLATWMLCGLLYFAYFIFVKSTFFKISDIKVLGTGGYVNTNDLYQVILPEIKNKSIFTVNAYQIQQNILKTFLGAKDVELAKKLPNKVIITVRERNPIAILIGKDNKKYLVDIDGYIMGQVQDNSSNLPEIIFNDDVEIGKFLNKNIIPIGDEIINSAKNDNLLVSSISFSSRYCQLYVNKDILVFMSLDKNIKEMVTELATVLKNLTLEGKSVRKVDLRFDKVIVSYD